MPISAYMPDVKVEVAFDAGVRTAAASRTWTDVSDYVELQDEIQITRGRDGELSTTSPSTMTLKLDNSDGRFTPGLASSPYYPNVTLGRPIRVLTNLLTNGNFEVDTSGWTGGNAGLAQITTPVHSGGGALRMTRVGAGDMSAGTATGTSGMPVTPLNWYAASVWFRAATTGRSCQARMRFYDSGGSLISTVLSSAVSDTTSGWTEAYLSVQAPANAAYGSLGAVVTAPGASEQHYIDDAFFGAPRFTGYVDEWPVEWDSGISGIASSRLSATGRLARLGEGAELRSIIETEILADNPVAYYPLGEAEGADHAVEFTGSDQNGMFSWYPGNVGITFGAANGPLTDGLPAVQIFPYHTGEKQVMLKANFFANPLTAATVEIFVRPTPDPQSWIGNFIALYDANPVTTGDVKILLLHGVGVDVGGDKIESIEAQFFERVLGVENHIEAFKTDYTPTVDVINGRRTNHLALTFTPGSPPTIALYINGVLAASGGSPSGPLSSTMPQWDYLILGPVLTDTNEGPMAVSHAVVFNGVLSADRIAAHANSGLTGFAGELADDRIERYARYAGIEAAEIVADSGVVPLSHIDTTSKTPEALLRTIETTENGIVFDGRQGTLNFHDRDHRYQAVSAFTLDAAQQHIEADGLRPVLDRSTLINEVTARSTNGTVEKRYLDATAADETGPRRVDIEVASTDAAELLSSASWRVNKYKDPQPRITALAPVDILPLSTSLRDSIRDADISTKFTVSNLPAQAPSTTQSFFIEGITETIGRESWRFQFNVSPSNIYDDVWVLGDASHGQLGTTTILAL